MILAHYVLSCNSTVKYLLCTAKVQITCSGPDLVQLCGKTTIYTNNTAIPSITVNSCAFATEQECKNAGCNNCVPANETYSGTAVIKSPMNCSQNDQNTTAPLNSSAFICVKPKQVNDVKETNQDKVVFVAEVVGIPLVVVLAIGITLLIRKQSKKGMIKIGERNVVIINDLDHLI